VTFARRRREWSTKRVYEKSTIHGVGPWDVVRLVLPMSLSIGSTKILVESIRLSEPTPEEKEP